MWYVALPDLAPPTMNVSIQTPIAPTMHRIIGGRIACNYVGGVNGAMRELGAMIGWNIKIQGEPACPVQVALFGVMTPSGIIHRIEAQTEGTAHIRINPVSHTMTVVYA